MNQCNSVSDDGYKTVHEEHHLPQLTILIGSTVDCVLWHSVNVNTWEHREANSVIASVM